MRLKILIMIYIVFTWVFAALKAKIFYKNIREEMRF